MQNSLSQAIIGIDHGVVAAIFIVAAILISVRTTRGMNGFYRARYIFVRFMMVILICYLGLFCMVGIRFIEKRFFPLFLRELIP
jgi:hypothetical protein